MTAPSVFVGNAEIDFRDGFCSDNIGARAAANDSDIEGGAAFQDR